MFAEVIGPYVLLRAWNIMGWWRWVLIAGEVVMLVTTVPLAYITYRCAVTIAALRTTYEIGDAGIRVSAGSRAALLVPWQEVTSVASNSAWPELELRLRCEPRRIVLNNGLGPSSRTRLLDAREIIERHVPGPIVRRLLI
jgi:hypothetical protein